MNIPNTFPPTAPAQDESANQWYAAMSSETTIEFVTDNPFDELDGRYEFVCISYAEADTYNIWGFDACGRAKHQEIRDRQRYRTAKVLVPVSQS